MSYEVILTNHFRKKAKRLLKKYAHLKTELAHLGGQLKENPSFATSVGNGVYKIYLSVTSKNKEKFGGARVTSFVRVVGETVFFLSIYNKVGKDNISNEEIEELLKDDL